MASNRTLNVETLFSYGISKFPSFPDLEMNCKISKKKKKWKASTVSLGNYDVTIKL